MKPADDEKQDQEKKPYEAPRVTELGTVTDLTRGASGKGIAESRGISLN